MRTYKIACCIPFHQQVTLPWALDLRRLQLPPDHVWIITSHYQLDQSREELARDAMQSDCTHALFIDTDIRVPTNGVQVALSHNYPIVSGLYWAKRGTPAAWNWIEGGKGEPVAPPPGGYGLVDYCGLGFCLIDCRVFKRLSTPFFVYERADDVVSIKLDDDDKMVEALTNLKEQKKLGVHSEDSYFFRKVRNETGIRPIIDSRITLLHEEMMQFWPDGQIEYQKTVREPLEVDFEMRKIVGR